MQKTLKTLSVVKHVQSCCVVFPLVMLVGSYLIVHTCRNALFFRQSSSPKSGQRWAIICPGFALPSTFAGAMRSALLVAVLSQLWGAFSTDSCEAGGCEADLNTALQQEGPDASVELLQVKSLETGEAAEDEDEYEEEAEAKNGDGRRRDGRRRDGRRRGPDVGDLGGAYVHHNPPGVKGGRGSGTSVVKHNPPGIKGGVGSGTTVVHSSRRHWR